MSPSSTTTAIYRRASPSSVGSTRASTSTTAPILGSTTSCSRTRKGRFRRSMRWAPAGPRRSSGSSSARPFELAACGAAIVSNPYEGLSQWFEPDSEVRIVSSADEATEAYRDLLADPGAAEEMGRLARERTLSEHTYAQRARRLL